jgi:hypothetical protein
LAVDRLDRFEMGFEKRERSEEKFPFVTTSSEPNGA